MIANIYYWFWHDFLCRKEPFTPQLQRFVKKHKVAVILSAGGVFSFIMWLILHLGDI